jgi:hypothetical protein
MLKAVRRSFKVHFELGRFDPANATTWAKLFGWLPKDLLAYL